MTWYSMLHPSNLSMCLCHLRVSHLGSTSRGHFGQNGKKLHENYKINILHKTEGGHGGKAIVWIVQGGSPPSLLQLVETLRLILGLSQTFLIANTWLRNIFFEKFPHDNIQQNFWENNPVVNFNCSSVCKVILCFEKFSQMLRQDP